MKKTISIILALVMIISSFAFSASAASYPSVFAEEYSISVEPGEVVSIVYTIYHEYKNESITTITYDKDGTPLASAEQSFYPSTYTTKYTLNWDTTGYPAGEYTVVSQMSYYSLGRWNDAPNTCTVRVTIEGEVESGGETVAEAINLIDSEWHTKTWTYNNYDKNCYNKIELPERGYITFTMKKLYCDGEICTVDLSLHDAEGKEVWICDTEEAMEDSFSETCEYKIGLAAGTYYMNIKPQFSVSSGMFEFEYKYTFTKADNWEIESNNTVVKATEITLGKTYTGVFCEEDYSSTCEDNYSFNLKKGQKYTLTIENYAELDAGSLIMDVFDPDGEELYLGTGKTSGNSQKWTITAEKSGDYILKFSNESNDKPIEYKVRVDEEACTHTNTVTLPAKAATYTSTGLTAGKKCSTCGTVTVKQKKVAKKKLKKVTISSVKSTKAKQANVSWKKVTDATGYVVEYSTSKKFTKKTTKKVTIKKAKTVKTTLKKLKSGKKYYIRVRAYKTVGKKTVYGSYSSVKTVKVK